MVQSFLNIAFYRFVALDDLPGLRVKMRARCQELALKGTILLAPEGINGFLAGGEASIRAIQAWMEEIGSFAGLHYKESVSEGVPFTRMLVKLKKEIISMGCPEVRPALKTGSRLQARELKRWLDEGKEVVLLDTRNDYEIRLGTFAGAKDLGLQTFRQFPEKLRASAAELQDKPVVMFCTGGIRCEKATALALELGIPEAYQLEGGILKYFEEVGGAHYQGECFVFDYRTAVNPELRESAAVHCFNCRQPVSAADQLRPEYIYEVSCPQCYSACSSASSSSISGPRLEERCSYTAE
ncbi:MAG: sulfurtransferase [Bdellovibrionota bacterium]